MPTTITTSSGNTYHLWQLPDLSNPEPSDKKTFTRLTNDLSDGYRSTRLFGSDTGVREWQIKLPTLAGGTLPVPTVTGPNGETVTREGYVRSVFEENMVTGDPFVYTDPSTGQYYLVDFADDTLTMERARIQLYSTGLTIRQRRLVGETVFNVADMYGSQPATWMKDYLTLDQSGNGNPLTASGDSIAFEHNEIETWRLNSIGTDGKLAQTATITLYDAFLVMQCREATFGQTSGILTGSAGTRALIGESGQSRFLDLSHTNFEYRLNGVLTAQGAATAPMQELAIVHLRWSSGFSVVNPQIGQDRAVPGTKAEIDVGEIIFVTQSNLPRHLVRELMEALTVKWNIT
jgi:hypothetical protein